uniref:NADH dehydrogenase subunit 6 n=1 Tax=Benedenia hoshinai TaxID=407255 RepID=E1U264_BENHO|nr:NADH dehydrogenase subunit 6 [Benedenia hoshinai]ABK58262.1 NADH dehydrogenase subunit 6 [Benedenia hoshinai]
MSILFFFYGLSLSLFGFISNAIGYCILLVINALIACLIIFFFSNSIWYSLLLYLIYVGGVYILFLFISVHIPNMNNYTSLNFYNLLLLSFFCFELSVNLFNSFNNFLLDNSFYFCSISEGFSYIFICSFLIISFILVSFISSTKIYFCR